MLTNRQHLKHTLLIKIVLPFFMVAYLLDAHAFTASNTLLSESKNDSITLWIKAAKNKNYTNDRQKTFLHKAYEALQSVPEQHTKAKNLSTIAYRFYQLKDTVQFKKINKETLDLAYKLKDSFAIADAHWNYAFDFFDREAYDQAYFHYNTAYNYFNKINSNYETGRMLFSMSFIKARYRDYNGSEVLTIEAIKKFKILKNNLFLYRCYNRLALLQNDIYEYDRALFYHQKALEYLEKVENKENHYAVSLNNIGVTYIKKRDYKTAIIYFNKSLSENKLIENYARVIDNRAYAKLMLGDTLNVEKDMLIALEIRDSTHNNTGVLINKIRLSEYYTYIKDTIKALKYAKEANVLAKKINNGRDYLRSLQQLANLDPKNTKKYLDRYIQFNDSLISVERKIQNKFTRIAYETDEYIEETKRLSQQKAWITGSGIGLTLILSLFYFLKVQKSKNEKLLLEAEQQKANEQVYLLTLKQQAILEEEKAQERNRISQELHDGILGRLFGTRMGLGFLDLTVDDATKQQHRFFLDELQDIEKEIRDVSHQLNVHFNSAEINFTSIINQLLKDKSTIGGFEFELITDKKVSWKKINEVIKVNVYRIVQESLQNIVKHAQAGQVVLDFSIANEQMVLLIKDDGIGFDTRKRKKGIGMKNIQSRVQKLNGKCQIASKPGAFRLANRNNYLK